MRDLTSAEFRELRDLGGMILDRASSFKNRAIERQDGEMTELLKEIKVRLAIADAVLAKADSELDQDTP